MGVVIFDEFHERNLLSDVALALVKRLQQNRASRSEDGRHVGDARGGAGGGVSEDKRGTGETPVLHSEGQSFPVEVRYLSQHDERPVTEQAADVVEQIVNSGEPGDILVFMPGMGEINATIAAAPGRPDQRTAGLDPVARRLAARAAGPGLCAESLAQGGGRHQRRGDLGHH